MDYYNPNLSVVPGAAAQGTGQFGLGLQAAGGFMSVMGALGSAWGSKIALDGQAELARINAQIMETNARGTLQAGAREVQRSQLATSQLKGRQRAGMAAHGVDLGEGSAARVLTDTDVMGEIDANTIAANAVRSAWGYRTQSVNFQNEAIQKSSAADSMAPWMSAGGMLMDKAGSVAQSWYQLKRSGG